VRNRRVHSLPLSTARQIVVGAVGGWRYNYSGMSIDSRLFRQTVGQFVTGVTVIAVEADGSLRAMTANSFTSVSLDPPLVLFCLGKGTKAGQTIRDARGFSVNILRQDQQELSLYFAGAWKGETPPRFSFVEWDGGPRLEGCVAALGCQVVAVHEGGDHWIVVGEVVAMHRDDTVVRPLVFYGGRYVRLAVGERLEEEPFMIAWAAPNA
jgi:flavin reductase (DIM6/NTAB) family NADH-FMN oxidoreductase RutF